MIDAARATLDVRVRQAQQPTFRRMEVNAKRLAGEQWARFARDHPDPSTWRYLLVGETDLFNAKGNWDLLLAQAEART